MKNSKCFQENHESQKSEKYGLRYYFWRSFSHGQIRLSKWRANAQMLAHTLLKAPDTEENYIVHTGPGINHDIISTFHLYCTK